MASNEPAVHPCLTNDELSRFHARELAESELAAVRDHLARCGDCAARGERLLAEHETWVRKLRRIGAPPLVRTSLPKDGEAGLQTEDVPGYEIVEEVGRGGQGIIYRAVQESTRREVALKVLREGTCASPTARKRFEREIELVAALRHPNIVTLFDSGRTRDGRRYLVMDFVRGQPLRRYLRTVALPVRGQLALFGRICTAVNAAHQRGVIHRDLKPSNILVSEAGEPYVLDFGLARQATSDGGTAMTVTGEVAGTLPYLSPEQARGLPDAVDIRSDVYALGVILYEMLTGKFPYPVEGDAIQVLKHIAETPPAPPDRAAARGPEAGESGIVGSRATGRGTAGRFDHDLRTVVLKALAKERERRYQTAGDLARDIERYLAGEPIEAKRDSNLYLLRKTLQRYRLGVALATATVLVVAASAIALGVMYASQTQLRAEAERQATLARAAESEARARFNDVRDLTRFFVLGFDNQIKRLPGSAPARQALVEKGLQYLELLARDAGDDPALQSELANGYMSIGNVQGELQASNLGNLHAALESYRQADRVFEELIASGNESVEVMRDSVVNLIRIGDVVGTIGHEEECLATFRKALERAERYGAAYPDNLALRGNLANAHERVGNVLAWRGRVDEALEHYEASAANMARIPDEHRDPFAIEHERVAGLTRRGNLAYQQGRLEEALVEYRTANELAKRLLAKHPNDRASRQCTAVAAQWIGIVLSDLGRHAEAIEVYRPTILLMEQNVRDAPTDAAMAFDLATTLSRLGESQMSVGERDAARNSYVRSLEMAAEGAHHNPDFAVIHRLHGVACYKMAELDIDRAKDESLPQDERLEHWRAARGWLGKCLEVFVNMRERGQLSAGDAGVPEELSGEIAELDRTIEQFDAPE